MLNHNSQPLIRSQLKKQFNKGGYHSGASAFKMALWYFTSLLFFRSGLMPASKLLVVLLRLFGSRIGRDVRIKPFVNIKYPWKLTIGDHCWIGEHCWIDNLAEVYLGKNVCLSQGAMILTGNHNYRKATFDLITRSVRIGDGAWIGCRAVVCPGVEVASHAVLTVGSVASKDLEPYSVYRGNPAKKIRERTMAAY